tara:strand:+ start:2052 stop:2459 length:408 start_codon:yes stop_codon:yes gene_type:complete
LNKALEKALKTRGKTMHIKNTQKKQKKLEKTLTIFKNLEIPFTSLDFSNYLKRSGFWIRNKEVSTFLFNEFNKKKSLEDFSSTEIEVLVNKEVLTATVYCPKTMNPNLYLKIDQKAITKEEFEKNYKKVENEYRD